MSPILIIATIAAYMLVLLLIAHLTGRNADNSGFFTGNRRSPQLIVSLAMIGAAISGVTFVSVPGSVATSNFSYMQMVLGFVVGYVAIAFVLIPIFYRLNVVSLYEYLNIRFGVSSHKTGAWLFFVSKVLGASLRVFVVCTVLQHLIFAHYGIPFWVNAFITMGLVWLYTQQGGVKSVVWVDAFKTVLLVGSVSLCIFYVVRELGFTASETFSAMTSHEYSKTFFLEDFNDGKHFVKQFLAGVFMVIAMTGLDQDLMQKVLSSRSAKESQRNMIVSGTLQAVVIFLFLLLGVLLYIYASHAGIVVEEPDNLFAQVATSKSFPIIVGIVFVLGLISSTYSAAGSALTALTTSFTVDILGGQSRYDEQKLRRVRRWVHISMAVLMSLAIVAFELWSNDSVINLVYGVASYTYGPLLGMFAFGIFTKRQVRDKFIPVVAVLSPVICYILDKNSAAWFGGYHFSFELLILNAAITAFGLYLLSLNYKPKK
ncbi:MAG: sodium:solute symporter [Alistipes sp.]|nr:sodium:solute symporter [Alistipes sp.]